MSVPVLVANGDRAYGDSALYQGASAHPDKRMNTQPLKTGSDPAAALTVDSRLWTPDRTAQNVGE